jgi:hypothetical protein
VLPASDVTALETRLPYQWRRGGGSECHPDVGSSIGWKRANEDAWHPMPRRRGRWPRPLARRGSTPPSGLRRDAELDGATVERLVREALCRIRRAVVV